MAHTPSNTPKTFKDFERLFPDETAAKTYLAMRRWPDGPICPKCGNKKVYTLKARPFNWLCKSETCLKRTKTGYRFSLYVGTIFENTNYPLLTWFKVLYLMLQSKKGMSALQIHRMIGTGSYRTAWYIAHRLRAGLSDPEFVRLVGVVEVDETFIGGKDRNRHRPPALPERVCVPVQQPEEHRYVRSRRSILLRHRKGPLPLHTAPRRASQPRLPLGKHRHG